MGADFCQQLGYLHNYLCGSKFHGFVVAMMTSVFVHGSSSVLKLIIYMYFTYHVPQKACQNDESQAINSHNKILEFSAKNNRILPYVILAV